MFQPDAFSQWPQSDLKGTCCIAAGTTALAGPQVAPVPIEGHDEKVEIASIRVPVEGIRRSARHPGLAGGVHLRRMGQLCFLPRTENQKRPGNRGTS